MGIPRSAVAALALAAAWPLACGGGAAPASAPSARAERATIERIVVATGTIEPEREIDVRPRIPGIVEKIHVKAGDHVEAGAPLVEIERDLLEAQEREARASLESAQVERRYAEINQTRLSALAEKGAASARALDDARARFESAGAAVARQRANLESLQVQLSYTRLTAPSAGKILDVHVEEGDAVSPVTAVTGGTLLLSLAGTSTLHLDGLVDENEVARVSVGQPARLRTEAYAGRTFEGRVREIAPVGKREQNVTYFEVEVEVVDREADLLRPRMSADADIVTERVEGALVVPETALRYEGKQIYVEVRNGSDPRAPRRSNVSLGITDGDRVQILSGLSEGEEVVLQ